MKYISVEQMNEACDNEYKENYAHGGYCHEQSFRFGFQEGVEFTEQKLADTEYNRGFEDAIEKAKQIIINFMPLPSSRNHNINLDKDALEERYKYAIQIATRFEDKMNEKRNVKGFNAIVRTTSENKLINKNFKDLLTNCKPFESRVLVRNVNGDLWKPALYGFSPSKGGCYVVGGTYWKQCIPYENNEHLLGKCDDCIDFYKNLE